MKKLIKLEVNKLEFDTIIAALRNSKLINYYNLIQELKSQKEDNLTKQEG